MRIAVVFDTPYEGWTPPDHERQMVREVEAWHEDEPEMEYQIADALRRRNHQVQLVGVRDDLQYLVRALAEFRPELVFDGAETFHGNPTLEYLPLQSDASAGIAQASVVQDAAALAERVALVHQRFHQPAIAEQFVEGRELYVSMIGNGEAIDILPITEMVFDRRRTRPEERIATKAAKWDEDYRARKGIRNVLARPLSRAVRQRIETICQTAFRALWLRDYARLDVRLAPDGEVWFLEANANPFISYGHDMGQRGGEGRPGLLPVHPAAGGRSGGPV